MTYSKSISFPMTPTEKDIKALRKKVAHETFGVVNGGQVNKKRPADGRNKAKSNRH